MPKPVLLLDMDGVVANFAKTLIEEYNKTFNASLSLDQWTSFEVSHCFGKEAFDKMEPLYNAPGFFEKIEPYPGSLEVINDVAEKVHIEVCSTPTKLPLSDGKRQLNPHCAFEKFEWIHKHLPVLSNNITLTTRKHLLQADVLVDDALHNIATWCKSNPGGIGFLVDRGWNQTTNLPRNCVRKNLSDLPAFLKKEYGV